MSRIAVHLSEEISALLKQYQHKKGLDSITQSLREMVRLGLKAEGLLPAENTAKSSETITSTILKTEESIWICEMRLLLRYLVENTPKQPTPSNRDILDGYKKKAQAYVPGTWQ